MLSATMRERESMFWSLSGWLFSLVVFVVFVVFVVLVVHLFQCPVDVAIPAGRGVNAHMKKVGLLEISLKFLYQGFWSRHFRVFMTKHHYF